MNKSSKILVVDDDEEIGMMLQTILEHKGFSVIVLQRSEQIEETISLHNINLILLDMLIGGVMGTNVCLRLKANTATASIPIIMLTALPGAEIVCMEAGANDFLSKPFEIDILVAKITQLL